MRKILAAVAIFICGPGLAEDPLPGEVTNVNVVSWEAGAIEVTATLDEPVAVEQSGTWVVDQGTGGLSAWLVTGPLTDAQLRASPISVSGPLTDAELRATPVPVSGTVAATQSGAWTVTANQGGAWTVTANAGTGTFAVSGPLTDAELRASPVVITGTVTANAGTGTFAVAGTVTANQGGAWTVTANAGTGTFAVSGPLTDAELRASPVDVAAAQSGTWTVQPGNTQNTTAWYTMTLDRTATDTWTGTDDLVMELEGSHSVGVVTTSTTSGVTTTCDYSMDGTNWIQTYFHNENLAASFTIVSLGGGATETRSIVIPRGARFVRVKATAPSGSTDVLLVSSQIPSWGGIEAVARSVSLGNANNFPKAGIMIGGYIESDDNQLDSTSTVEGGFGRIKVNHEGRILVETDHPNRINCTISSTATTSTIVTGCAAPGAGLSLYITDISYASSIIATTTNFMTLQYGTGGACGTGTTPFWRMFQSPAFGAVMGQGMTTPI